MTANPAQNGALWTLLRPAWSSAAAVAIFSIVINLLYLVTPLYMLQVYDRILVSGSRETLALLSAAAVLALVVLGALDHLRKLIAIRVGGWVEACLTMRIFPAEGGNSPVEPGGQALLRDIRAVRAVIAGPAAFLPFDLPWMFLFTGVLFLLHPLLGVLGLVAALLLVVLAFVNAVATARHSRQMRAASDTGIGQREVSLGAMRGVARCRAMGLADVHRQRWQAASRSVDADRSELAELGSVFQACVRTLRMIAQLGVLGAGALLVLDGRMSAGAMIAGSILLGRSLAPAETLFQVWPQMAPAREGLRRLGGALAGLEQKPVPTQLPAARGALGVENAAIAPSKGRRPLLRGLALDLDPGEVLAVIGPAGSGKSVFCRALAGDGEVLGGAIRLDGAALHHWPQAQFARAVGYLAETESLAPGTIRDNIARFSDCEDSRVVEAAQLCGVHDAILGLEDGYQTRIANDMPRLASGLVRQIALARAVFSKPALVVLDSPFEGQDQDGEGRILQAVARLKRAGASVVVATHRQTVLGVTDKILMLRDGRQDVFGRRDDVTRILDERRRFAARQPDRTQQERAEL
jgi:PrtD family type I secretion system ABC transporter